MIFDQSAVIPYRSGDNGAEVMLITSRRRKHWVIPKGLIEPHLSASESAASEAYEEAGLLGRTSTECIGEYEYKKWGGTCRVRVYPMEVEREVDEYPEAGQRKRWWVDAREAAEWVREPGLKEILNRFAGSFRKNTESE